MSFFIFLEYRLKQIFRLIKTLVFNRHIHTVSDGRCLLGNRVVYADGKRIDNVKYADIKSGYYEFAEKIDYLGGGIYQVEHKTATAKKLEVVFE